MKIKYSSAKYKETGEMYPYELINYYPYNLAWEALTCTCPNRELFCIYYVYAPGVKVAMTMLSERERKVIFMRYHDKKNLDEVATEFNVTRERIRQIQNKALRKLMHPRRSMYWYLDTVDKRIEKEKELSECKLLCIKLRERLKSYETNEAIKDIVNDLKERSMSIDNLDLSVRSYNCLKRKGVKTIDDLVQLTEDDLMHIRNLGRKSYLEILSKLEERGLSLKEVNQCVNHQ